MSHTFRLTANVRIQTRVVLWGWLRELDIGNVVFTSPVTVKRIHVIGTSGTVAGHAYRIEDQQGELLYRTQANGAYYESESITQRKWTGGIKVITLASGAIDIEYDRDTKY